MLIIFSKNSILTNRDVYNCTDECIRSKHLSGEYDILRITYNKTKNVFCYECGEYTESVINTLLTHSQHNRHTHTQYFTHSPCFYLNTQNPHTIV